MSKTGNCSSCAAAGRASDQHKDINCPHKGGQRMLGFEQVRKAQAVEQGDATKDSTAGRETGPVGTSNIQEQPRRRQLAQTGGPVVDLTIDGAGIFKKLTTLSMVLEAFDPNDKSFNQSLPRLEQVQVMLNAIEDEFGRFEFANPLASSNPPRQAKQRVAFRWAKETLQQSRRSLCKLTKKARAARIPPVHFNLGSTFTGIIKFDSEEAPRVLGKSTGGNGIKMRSANHRLPTVLRTILKRPSGGFEQINLAEDDAIDLDENERAAEQNGEGLESKHRIFVATPRTATRVRLNSLTFKTGKKLRGPQARGWKWEITPGGSKFKKNIRASELDTITEEALPFAKLVVTTPKGAETAVHHAPMSSGSATAAPLSGRHSRGRNTRQAQRPTKTYPSAEFVTASDDEDTADEREESAPSTGD